MTLTYSKTVLVSLLAVSFFGITLLAHAADTPEWDTSGTYTVTMNYLGSDYGHEVTLVQDDNGNLTGSGGSPVGAPVYTWVVTSGVVAGNTLNFLAHYTATADAVTPQTVLHVVGTVALDGTLSGTWSDNYQGGTRTGTWEAASGTAQALGTLVAEDFGVVISDTGLGILKGYTAGFGLTDATFAQAESVTMQLYALDMLLQTNVSTPKVTTDITGVQISSPFDVSGSFDYGVDGYWTNTRESEYGQTASATKVVATVVLANGKVLTAENSNLTGDPATIFVVTPPVIIDEPQSKDECKKGGWKTYTHTKFKNQGQCVAFVNHRN